jgi:signal transduction histidine kinase/ligand-binding sensor domain-containing protein
MAKYSPLPVFAACSLLATVFCDAAPRFVAQTWQSEDGLPSNSLRAVAQASDGYLWVGTAEGVVRFDGVRFTGFLAEPDSTLARLPVRALFPLANGDVWEATGNALLRGRGTRLDEVQLPPYSKSGAAPAVSQVVLGTDSDVFAVRGIELWQITPGKMPRAVEQTPALEKLLQEDAERARQHGRVSVSAGQFQLRDSLARLWRFIPVTGLTIASGENQPELVSFRGERPAVVTAMLEDREGNIWLATQTQGLWQLRATRVEVLTTADGLSHRETLLVREDHTGALWVATRAGGLDCFISGAAKHFDVPRAPRPVSALCETRSGDFWTATRDGSVFCLKDGAFRRMFGGESGATRVSAVVEDDQGRVWFGGQNGLFVEKGGELRPTDFSKQEKVTAIASSGPILWIGTENGQVFRGNADHFEPVAPAAAFASCPISSLLPDADGGLWIGTLGCGLFYLRDGQVRAAELPTDVVHPRLTCVLDDRAGFLWLGTLGGICRVPKSELLKTNAPGSESASLVLDRSDGLLTRECTHGGQPAGWRARDGTLWFATGNGVAHVDPKQLTLNTVPPPVVIEEVSANGDELASHVEQVTTGPGRSRLEFHFTALSFTAPEKVRFRTRLEGLDETWRDVGHQRTVAYEAVPPGSYRFRVVAENGDGIWNESGATLAVKVLPHFWETRSFQIGIAVAATTLAVSIGALIMRARMRGRLLRLEAQSAREAERARIAQDLHDDLGASLTEISLLANLAAEEHQQIPEEDNTLTDIASTAQSLVGTLDEIVWAANPRHDTLRSLVEYLTAFAAKFLARANITLRREVPRDLPEMSLDAERRHSVFLAAREALNNAVKHSGASEIWLRVRLENQRLEIAVEDNGRGFDPHTSDEGEGVGNLTSRLARIGGQCRIESRAGSGTRVSLSLLLS